MAAAAAAARTRSTRTFDQTNSWQGSQRALLLAIALAQQ